MHCLFFASRPQLDRFLSSARALDLLRPMRDSLRRAGGAAGLCAAAVGYRAAQVKSGLCRCRAGVMTGLSRDVNVAMEEKVKGVCRRMKLSAGATSCSGIM